jgi:1-acyl-sn-glycerol-3-phosphate acyltransferase
LEGIVDAEGDRPRPAFRGRPAPASWSPSPPPIALHADSAGDQPGPRADEAGAPASGRTWTELAGSLLETGLDPTELHHRDPAFIRAVLPYLDAFTGPYFRPEFEGVEHIPKTGPFIAAGNHNGGPVLADLWTLLAFWEKTIGPEFPIYAMVHDAVFKVPIAGNAFLKLGGLRACPESASRVLESGGGVLAYPGGELDCCRTFWDRNRIDLHGRTGFIKLAFRYGAPILPFVNAGGHETLVTLVSSRRLARWTGLERLLRVKTFTVSMGLPWGIFATPLVPFIPLPAKFVYRAAEPIRVEHDPDRANDETAVRRVYRQVTEVMQDMLDDLARRRRFPVLG